MLPRLAVFYINLEDYRPTVFSMRRRWVHQMLKCEVAKDRQTATFVTEAWINRPSVAPKINILGRKQVTVIGFNDFHFWININVKPVRRCSTISTWCWRWDYLINLHTVHLHRKHFCSNILEVLSLFYCSRYKLSIILGIFLR